VSETGTKAEQLVNALELAIASRMDAEDDRDESEGEECLNRAIRAELTARTALLAYISELEADRERIEWLEASVDDRHEVRVRPVTALGGRHVCIDAIGLHENG
jgi:hypothetical protein